MSQTEKPLKGANYLVIGASRGLGAATTIELAKAGANIVAIHGDSAKEKRIQKIKDELGESGVNVQSSVFDISDTNQCTELAFATEFAVGGVDGVFYFPAGGLIGTDEAVNRENAQLLNISAPQQLARALYEDGAIVDGGFFALVPSIYSWLYGRIDCPFPNYKIVAETKQKGEIKTRRLIRELWGEKVKTSYLIGHAFADTIAAKMLLTKGLPEKMDPQEKERVIVEVIGSAWTNGENRLPETKDAGVAAVEMAILSREGKMSNGYRKFVGIDHWDRSEIKNRLNVYGDNAIWVDDMIFLGDKAFGYLDITPERCAPIFEDGEITVDADGVGHLTVTEEHTKDHFNIKLTDGNRLAIMPGVKTLAAVIEVARMKGLPNFWPAFAQDIKFSGKAYPGDELKIKVDVSDFIGSMACQAEVFLGDQSILSIGSMLLGYPSEGVSGPRVEAPMLVEASAQSALLAYLKKNNTDMSSLLPLFGSLAEFDLDSAPIGSMVEIDPTLKESGRKEFAADAKLFIDGGEKREVIEMKGPVRARNVMAKALGVEFAE